MNLLGMKRKLLPYGMPLGGAIGRSGGGSAAPAGGKSSGLGGRGYQAAPGFSQQPQVQQPGPMGGMGGMPISSVNSTTQADMMGGNRDGGMPPMQALQGGKSSGLGGLGYQAAPGFGQQQPQVQQMGPVGSMGAAAAQADMMGGSLSGFTPQQMGISTASPEMERRRSQAAMNHPMSQPDPIKLQAMQQQMMQGRPQPTFTPSPGMPFGGVGGRPFASQQTPEGYQRMQDYYAQDRINQANRGKPPMQQQLIQQPMQQQRDQYLQSSPIAQQLNQLSSSLNGAQPTQAQLSQMQSLNNQLQQDPGLARIHQQMQQQQAQMQPMQQPIQSLPIQQPIQPRPMQQPMQRPQNISGLQELMNKMRGQQQPMQQPRPMPKFQSKALQFKPNTQNAQAALSRVKPSVQKQNQDAQAARIAELEAQIAAQQQQSYDYGGNGG